MVVVPIYVSFRDQENFDCWGVRVLKQAEKLNELV